MEAIASYAAGTGSIEKARKELADLVMQGKDVESILDREAEA